MSEFPITLLWILLCALLVIVLGIAFVPPLRRRAISAPLLGVYRRLLPDML